MNAAQLETLSRSALEIVTQDRNRQYGEPEDSFAAIAALWNGYLHAKPLSRDLTIDDVARMMELMKMARRMTAKQPKADSYIDAMGYVLCEAKMQETAD